MSLPARAVTAEELFQYQPSRYCELVRGVPRVFEPPGGLHGRIAGRIVARLGDHVERLGLGTVLVEAGYVLQRAPDTVRGPDVSFISAHLRRSGYEGGGRPRVDEAQDPNAAPAGG
jgi:Uma2 family endonuclease